MEHIVVLRITIAEPATDDPEQTAHSLVGQISNEIVDVMDIVEVVRTGTE